jgi:hypothetical protein
MKNESSKSQPKEANVPEPVLVPKPEPTPVVNTVSQNNGIAVASMVIGIVALLIAWIPFIGFIGFIGGITAIVLGIIALKKAVGKGMSIAGIIMGALSILSSLAMTFIFFGLIVLGTAAVKDSAGVTGTNNNTNNQVQTSYKVGDVINFDGKKVTVTSVERNWNSGSQFTTPQSGYEFVKVQITIENDSSNQISYGTYDWQLQDSKGVIKDVAFATYSTDGALGSGDLAPNGKVSGFIIFEVPSGDTGLVLQYSPSFLSDKTLNIKL